MSSQLSRRQLFGVGLGLVLAPALTISCDMNLSDNVTIIEFLESRGFVMDGRSYKVQGERGYYINRFNGDQEDPHRNWFWTFKLNQKRVNWGVDNNKVIIRPGDKLWCQFSALTRDW